MNVHLLGLSYRTAPVPVRESLAFSDDDAAVFLAELRAALPAGEAVLLSTCNRTELYLAADPGVPAADVAHAVVRRLRPGAPVTHEECWRYAETGAPAVRHLARVAAGLDSAILGDSDIVAQLKRALAIADRAGTLGPVLRRATTSALRAAKRARAETGLSAGGAGIGSAVASAVTDRLGDCSGLRFLVLGAGDAALAVARQLAKRGVHQIAVANRTPARAEVLAGAVDGTVVTWAAVEAAFDDADVVVAATGSSQPVVRKAALDRAVARRGHRRLLVVDAGFPRNVEPGSAAEVITLESLAQRHDALRARRLAAVPRAEAIVEEEVAEWAARTERLEIEDLIKHLHLQVSATCDELATRLAQEPLDAAAVARVVRRSVRRMVHDHVQRLRTTVEVGAG